LKNLLVLVFYTQHYIHHLNATFKIREPMVSLTGKRPIPFTILSIVFLVTGFLWNDRTLLLYINLWIQSREWTSDENGEEMFLQSENHSISKPNNDKQIPTAIHSSSIIHESTTSQSNPPNDIVENYETEPLRSDFIRRLPVEPWLPSQNNSCRVEFVNKDMSLCTLRTAHKFMDSIAFDVAIRLLEHRYECPAKHLKQIMFDSMSTESNCLWIVPPIVPNHFDFQSSLKLAWPIPKESNDTQSNVIFLLSFLWSDYYALITARNHFPLQYCWVSYTSSDQPIPSKATANFTLEHAWREVMQRAMYCDYIATNSLEVMVLADSMGIPGFFYNQSHPTIFITDTKNYNIPRFSGICPIRDRLQYDAAQRIVETFPFSHFMVATNITRDATTDNVSLQNKTLVIIIGSLRGGEKSWHSMYKHLLDENNADLALMVGEGGNHTLSPYQRAKYVWEFKEYEDWADAIDLIDGPAWRETVLPKVLKKSGIVGGVTGYVGSGAIIFMARFWVQQKLDDLNLLDVYDRVVLTRSDYFYACAHNLQQLDPRYIWIPAGEDYGGLSDRHWILNKYHVRRALRINENLVKRHQYLFVRYLGMNPELMIRFCWTIEGLFPHQVRRFARSQYTVFIAGVDKSRWEQKKSRGMDDQGHYLKYQNEYYFAKCYCEGGHVTDASTGRNLSEGNYTDSWQDWNCNHSQPTTHG
jgi:hypothetical protein